MYTNLKVLLYKTYDGKFDRFFTIAKTAWFSKMKSILSGSGYLASAEASGSTVITYNALSNYIDISREAIKSTIAPDEITYMILYEDGGTIPAPRFYFVTSCEPIIRGWRYYISLDYWHTYINDLGALRRAYITGTDRYIGIQSGTAPNAFKFATPLVTIPDMDVAEGVVTTQAASRVETINNTEVVCLIEEEETVTGTAWEKNTTVNLYAFDITQNASSGDIYYRISQITSVGQKVLEDKKCRVIQAWLLPIEATEITSTTKEFTVTKGGKAWTGALCKPNIFQQTFIINPTLLEARHSASDGNLNYPGVNSYIVREVKSNNLPLYGKACFGTNTKQMPIPNAATMFNIIVLYYTDKSGTNIKVKINGEEEDFTNEFGVMVGGQLTETSLQRVAQTLSQMSALASNAALIGGGISTGNALSVVTGTAGAIQNVTSLANPNNRSLATVKLGGNALQNIDISKAFSWWKLIYIENKQSRSYTNLEGIRKYINRSGAECNFNCVQDPKMGYRFYEFLSNYIKYYDVGENSGLPIAYIRGEFDIDGGCNEEAYANIKAVLLNGTRIRQL